MKTLANSLVTVSSKIEVVLNVLFFSFSFALLRKEHAFAVLIEVKRGSLHFCISTLEIMVFQNKVDEADILASVTSHASVG